MIILNCSNINSGTIIDFSSIYVKISIVIMLISILICRKLYQVFVGCGNKYNITLDMRSSVVLLSSVGVFLIYCLNK